MCADCRSVRERGTDNQPPFGSQAKTLNRLYNQVLLAPFFSPKSYADTTDEELETKLREEWEHFKESDLPLILKLVATI